MEKTGDSKSQNLNKNKGINIPGTKPNAQNACLLVSTGIPSLDNIIGGGLAVGTIFLVEDDVYGSYGQVILKYFLAEGVINKHSLFVASKDINPKTIVTELPALVNEDIPEEKQSDVKMSIAWRYQHLPQGDENKKLLFGHYYDLSKSMDKKTIEETFVEYWDNTAPSNKPIPNTFENPAYHELLQDIKDFITKHEFEIISNPAERNILRIAIHNLGSAFWLPLKSKVSVRDKDLDMFLFCLKALMRTAYAVASITVPSDMIQKDCMVRCIHATDAGIRLESFMGTANESNPALSDYNGFFKVTKAPEINTIEPLQSVALDLAFKLRRKKFVIEKLHLPPEAEDSTQRETGKVKLGCSSAGGSNLDF